MTQATQHASSARILLLSLLRLLVVVPLAFGFLPRMIRPPPYATTRRAAVSTSLLHQSSSLDVQIFDGVLEPDKCLALHDLAVEFTERNEEGSSIFVRPPHNTHPLTPLEHAMHRILLEMDKENDNTSVTVVEYWWRDEFMNIDIHSDIDESLLEDQSILCCPDLGHVLYLQVMEDLKGPTCVVSKYGGWNESRNITTELVTVPAVQGRLLRFPGSAMHGVPKPIDRWLLTDEDERALRESEEEAAACESQEDEESSDDFDDDDDDGDCAVERSVLLFNCWSNQGPRGIARDAIGGTFPDGIEMDADAMQYMTQQEERTIEEWTKEFGTHGQGVACRPISEWISQNIAEPSEEEVAAIIRLSLMGKKKRRLHPKKNVKLYGPIESFRKAVHQKSTSTRFQLKAEIAG